MKVEEKEENNERELVVTLVHNCAAKDSVLLTGTEPPLIKTVFSLAYFNLIFVFYSKLVLISKTRVFLFFHKILPITGIQLSFFFFTYMHL